MHQVKTSTVRAGEFPQLVSLEARRDPRAANRSERRRAGRTVRAAGYGSLALSAWLITAVATGHGVAFADDSSGSSSDSANSSSTSSNDSSSGSSNPSSHNGSRPSTNLGPRPTRSTRDSDPDVDGDDAGGTSQTSSAAPLEPAGGGDIPAASGEAVDADDEPEAPGTDGETAQDGESPLEQEVPVESDAPVESQTPGPTGTGAGPVATEPVTKPDAFPVSDAGGNGTERDNDTRAVAGVVPSAIASPATLVGKITRTDAAPVSPARVSTPLAAAAPTAHTAGTDVVIPAAVTAPNPIAVVVGAVNRFVSALLSPFTALASSAPSGQNPFAWALLAFVRRTFFNQAPKIGVITVGQQQAGGVITGTIDAIDPDEMGKTVKIRANVFAFPAQPRIPEPDCGCAVVDGVAGLPFMNDAYLGTEPGSNWHAPDAVDITCVYIGATGAVTYTGKEIGQVTIDGLGTGDVTLLFDGVLLSATQEGSVAQLQPHLGTGDLKGVRGTVISESTLDATGAATGVLTGEVVRPEVRYKVVTQPKYGTVAIDPVTGQFTYTPDPAFAEVGGNDSFQVLATDGRFNVLNLFKKYNGDPVTTITLNVAGPVAV